ncbi:MAG: ATP-binding protein [Vulcanimicrobiota bacterium]
MQDSIPMTFEQYHSDYLRSTHRPGSIAWALGLWLSFGLEFWLDFAHAPLPLRELFLNRVGMTLIVILFYRARSEATGNRQMLFVALNFLAFASFAGLVGARVDMLAGVPVFAAMGLAIMPACALYPARLKGALLLPLVVGLDFFLGYWLGSGQVWSPGLTIALLTLTLSPVLATYGSVRLYRALEGAFELNQRLRDTVAQLAEAKQRLSVTLEHMGDAVVAVDTELRVERFNAAAVRLTGVPASQAIGRRLERVLCLVDREGNTVQACPQQALSRAQEWQAPPDTRLASAPTQPWVKLAGSTIVDEQQQPHGAVLVLHDLTSLKRLDEERLRASKLESLGRLAGGIAHDFNNALTSVQGHLSLLEVELQKNSVTESLFEARQGAVRARELASQLLTFSAGGAPIKRTIELAELVRKEVAVALTGTKVGLDFRGQAGLQAEVDPNQLAQALQSLTLNAVEAMPEGGCLTVSVEESGDGSMVHPNLRPGPYLRVVFQDHGKGIPPEALDRIFDPYYSTKGGHTGLGLTTAFSVAVRHGGTLTARTSSEGATFELYLPRLKTVAAEPDPAILAPTPGRRILVMDDEASVRTVTFKMLNRLGFEAETCSDGSQALELYQQAAEEARPFGLVIMDLTIPGGMGGEEAVRRLLSIDPEAVVMVASGYSNDPVMSEFASYGFRACLTKPFGLEELRTALRELGYK